MHDASQIPAIAEPLFLAMDATVKVHPMFTPEDMPRAMESLQLVVSWAGARSCLDPSPCPYSPECVEGILSEGRKRHRASEGARVRYAVKETSWIVPLASASVAPSEKTTT